MTPEDDLKRIAADPTMDQAVASAVSCARMVAASVVTYHRELVAGEVSEELQYDLVLQFAEVYARRLLDQVGLGKRS